MATDRPARHAGDAGAGWLVAFGAPADLRQLFGVSVGTTQQLRLAEGAGDVLRAAVVEARRRGGLTEAELAVATGPAVEAGSRRVVPRWVWAEGLARWRDGDLDATAAADRISRDLLDHLHHDTKAA